MFTILDALLEESDIDGHFLPPHFSITGEFIYMEINRVGFISAVRISFPYHSSHHFKSLYYSDNGTHIDEIYFSYS